MRHKSRQIALGATLLLRAVSARGQEPEATPSPKVAPDEARRVEATAGDAKEEERARPDDEKAGRLPLSYTERPLTLPRLILAPLAEFDVSRDDATFVNLGLGVAFGVTDDFELEANVAPLQLSPVHTYGQREQPGPSLGTTYRLYGGGTEVALHVDATVFTLPETSGAIIRPGLAFRSHAGKRVRIDFGFFVPVTTSHTTTGLQLPFALAVDLIEPLHVGVSSGITMASVDAAGSLAIPLGVFAGYAIGGKDGPILDIDPFFRWPALAGNTAPGTSTTDTFQVGVEIGGFFYL